MRISILIPDFTEVYAERSNFACTERRTDVSLTETVNSYQPADILPAAAAAGESRTRSESWQWIERTWHMIIREILPVRVDDYYVFKWENNSVEIARRRRRKDR